MITTRMRSNEILNEFWKDYKDTIRPRLLGWIRANKKSILRAPGRLKDDNGFVLLLFLTLIPADLEYLFYLARRITTT